MTKSELKALKSENIVMKKTSTSNSIKKSV